MGIHCCVFNPFRPILSALQNNRDHRKIAVIDGKAAITGGINLADEYINAFDKYGHWKDAAILVEGEAAWSMTVMFLEMWSFCRKTTEDLERFRPVPERVGDELIPALCRQPPRQRECGGARLSSHYQQRQGLSVHQFTLSDCGRQYGFRPDSGGEKRSGCADCHPTPVGQAFGPHHHPLLLSGACKRRCARVYEYSKGFLHSKTFVSDDAIATVGTTNMDFRSLYLHFECGVCVYDTPTVAAVKEDYLKTLENCQEMTPELCQCGRLTRAVPGYPAVVRPPDVRNRFLWERRCPSAFLQ